MLTQTETAPARKHRAGSDVGKRVAGRLDQIDDVSDAQSNYAAAVVGYRRIARQLRDALKAQGITQAAFAQECGCSARNISDYLSERCIYPLPAYITRRAIEMGLICWG